LTIYQYSHIVTITLRLVACLHNGQYRRISPTKYTSVGLVDLKFKMTKNKWGWERRRKRSNRLGLGQTCRHGVGLHNKSNQMRDLGNKKLMSLRWRPACRARNVFRAEIVYRFFFANCTRSTQLKTQVMLATFYVNCSDRLQLCYLCDYVITVARGNTLTYVVLKPQHNFIKYRRYPLIRKCGTIGIRITQLKTKTNSYTGP